MSAEAWFARLRADDVSPETLADFADWLATGSGNKAAFDELTELWHTLGEALPSADVVPLRPAESRPAESGDSEAIGAAFRNVGMSCRGCHDNYRVQD